MGNILFVAGSSALASAVEFVEALTIVLAVGFGRSWRDAFEGTVAAAAILAVLVVAVGFGALSYVPENALKTGIGALLLIFGLKWLRKAILRYSGLKALHDEDATFKEEMERLRGTGGDTKRDWLAVTTAFNGVLLEGLEVVFIVVALGATNKSLGAATAGAVGAAVIVILAGILLRRPLSVVPENTMKYVVGIMLTAFGTFWTGEGLGIPWWQHDVFIPILVAGYVAGSGMLIAWLRSGAGRTTTSTRVRTA